MHVRMFAAAVTAAVLVGNLQAGVPAAVADDSTPGPTVRTVARNLVGPLNVARNQDGTIYYTENFVNKLYRLRPGGKPEVIFRSAKKKTTVESVAVDRGRLRFAVVGQRSPIGLIKGFGPEGHPYTIADVYAFEQKRNPDHRFTYGFRKLSSSCADQLPRQVGPASYRGIVESHAYGMAVRGATTYVADAAANDILKVTPAGKVRLVAVLPPVPVTVTAELAEANGLPECTVGKVYRFEAVPTDVDVGPRGRLYVSSLPGGPEDGSAGANGSVVRVNPRTGRVVTVAGGLLSATGVAVGRRGQVFVSELFAGRISRIGPHRSRAVPFASVPLPAGIDLMPGGLLATINVLPPDEGAPNGKVVQIER